MCRVVSREFPLATAAVAEARTFVATALSRWELDSLVPDAELLTSELVTNSVLHARSTVTVTVTVAVADGVAEVGVADASTSLPQQRSPSTSTEGGRGLRLVELVAVEWGTADSATGKQVWFRLGVDSSWPHLTDCPCSGDQLERVRLESGRYAAPIAGPWDEVDG